MYEIYSQWCTEKRKKRAGRHNFTRMLREQNIVIHSLRKDQCNVFIGHNFGTIDEEIYKNHIELKTQGRIMKNELKASTDEKILVVRVDLQSVLLAPKTLASAIMYYKSN